MRHSWGGQRCCWGEQESGGQVVQQLEARAQWWGEGEGWCPSAEWPTGDLWSAPGGEGGKQTHCREFTGCSHAEQVVGQREAPSLPPVSCFPAPYWPMELPPEWLKLGWLVATAHCCTGKETFARNCTLQLTCMLFGWPRWGRSQK